MTLTACLDCGVRTNRTRCRPCAARWERLHRGSRGARGYDRRHQKRARAQVSRQPYCIDCGATTDLTAGHVIPGDPDSPLVTQCRPCNTAERNKRYA